MLYKSSVSIKEADAVMKLLLWALRLTLHFIAFMNLIGREIRQRGMYEQLRPSHISEKLVQTAVTVTAVS